jgi:hypothetical protein
LALHDAADGQASAHDLLVRLAAIAPHTLALPDRLDVERRAAVGEHAHDLLASALLVLAARALLVRDDPSVVDLAPVVPAAWWSQRWEALRAPTRHGQLSVAVRWKDERPTVHWELDARDPSAALTFTAASLAPEWSSTEHSGEVVFDPIAPPTPPEGGRAQRRISVAIGGDAAARNEAHDG